MSRVKPNNRAFRTQGSDAARTRVPRADQREPVIVVFTDLDGTLIDSRTYSFELATPALKRLKELRVPLVICSSKTRLEIEEYRKALDVPDPFIAENGGGIFVPNGYFPGRTVAHGLKTEQRDDYEVIVLGASYHDLRQALEHLRGEGFQIRGFGDMTALQVAQLTALSLDEAALAKERDFDEPFVLEGPLDIEALREHIERLGFRLTKGALYHILGESDKGRAVSLLCDFYRHAGSRLVTIGLGDSLNDASMLEQVDYPVLLQKADGSHDPAISLPNLIRAEGAGPAGWNTALMSLLEQLGKRGTVA